MTSAASCMSCTCECCNKLSWLPLQTLGDSCQCSLECVRSALLPQGTSGWRALGAGQVHACLKARPAACCCLSCYLLSARQPAVPCIISLLCCPILQDAQAQLCPCVPPAAAQQAAYTSHRGRRCCCEGWASDSYTHPDGGCHSGAQHPSRRQAVGPQHTPHAPRQRVNTQLGECSQQGHWLVSPRMPLKGGPEQGSRGP